MASGCDSGSARSPTLAPRSASKDRKSTRLNSSHVRISYAVFCLKKKNQGLFGNFTLFYFFPIAQHRDRRVEFTFAFVRHYHPFYTEVRDGLRYSAAYINFVHMSY